MKNLLPVIAVLCLTACQSPHLLVYTPQLSAPLHGAIRVEPFAYDEGVPLKAYAAKYVGDAVRLEMDNMGISNDKAACALKGTVFELDTSLKKGISLHYTATANVAYSLQKGGRTIYEGRFQGQSQWSHSLFEDEDALASEAYFNRALTDSIRQFVNDPRFRKALKDSC